MIHAHVHDQDHATYFAIASYMHTCCYSTSLVCTGASKGCNCTKININQLHFVQLQSVQVWPGQSWNLGLCPSWHNIVLMFWNFINLERRVPKKDNVGELHVEPPISKTD